MCFFFWCALQVVENGQSLKKKLSIKYHGSALIIDLQCAIFLSLAAIKVSNWKSAFIVNSNFLMKDHRRRPIKHTSNIKQRDTVTANFTHLLGDLQQIQKLLPTRVIIRRPVLCFRRYMYNLCWQKTGNQVSNSGWKTRIYLVVDGRVFSFTNLASIYCMLLNGDFNGFRR